MKIEKITISDYCNHYKIESSFIEILDEMGIVELQHENDKVYIDLEYFNYLERCRQLHYELHINLEGIDVILNLLDKQNKLQTEIQSLKNRLKLHE